MPAAPTHTHTHTLGSGHVAFISFPHSGQHRAWLPRRQMFAELGLWVTQEHSSCPLQAVLRLCSMWPKSSSETQGTSTPVGRAPASDSQQDVLLQVHDESRETFSWLQGCLKLPYCLVCDTKLAEPRRTFSSGGRGLPAHLFLERTHPVSQWHSSCMATGRMRGLDCCPDLLH